MSLSPRNEGLLVLVILVTLALCFTVLAAWLGDRMSSNQGE